jgi:hypothetical protein
MPLLEQSTSPHHATLAISSNEPPLGLAARHLNFDAELGPDVLRPERRIQPTVGEPQLASDRLARILPSTGYGVCVCRAPVAVRGFVCSE